MFILNNTKSIPDLTSDTNVQLLLPNSISDHEQKVNAKPTLFPPDVDSDVPEYPEFQDKTHPVPIGFDSVLSDLQWGEVTAADAMAYIVVNYLSDWKANKSFNLSIAKISECLGVSRSYVSKILKRVDRWLKKLKPNRSGTIYEIVKHAYENEGSPADARDSKFLAIPFGFGSPIERMFKGHISWKSCLVWIILKVHSDWSTGLTNPTNMLEIAKLCRMGAQTVCECIRELEDAGLLKRKSGKNEAAVYQLLPKPKPKKKKRPKSKGYGEDWDTDWSANRTATHQMSRNWQYRICMESGVIEKRVGYSKWKRATDYEVHQVIPKVIVEDLNLAFESFHSLRGHLLSS